MKFTTLCFLFVTAFCFSSTAQISIIPKIGITGSQFRTTQVVDPDDPHTTMDYKSVSGFVVGTGFQIPVSKNDLFSMQPEILFIQKGYRLEDVKSQPSYIEEESHHYIEMPVLARFTFGKKTIKGYTVIGPSASFLVGGNYYTELEQYGTSISGAGRLRFGEEPLNYSGEDYYYTNEQVNRFDVGLQIGGGISMELGPGKLEAELRYGVGLIPFYKDKYYNSSNFHSENITVALSVGYNIPLGKK